MAETNQLNHAWLAMLANPHHDGTTQQIDEFLQASPDPFNSPLRGGWEGAPSAQQ